MGDRANVHIRPSRPDSKGIYLYTHWGGYDLPNRVANALDSPAGRNRWDDTAYLTRIIFDNMTGGEVGETGFGISDDICDNEHPIINIDGENQKGWFSDQSGGNATEPLGFEAFITELRKGWPND